LPFYYDAPVADMNKDYVHTWDLRKSFKHKA
jgi:hypothetical protein